MAGWRDQWRMVGFAVPMIAAAGLALWTTLDIRMQPTSSGYEGLAFIGYMVFSIPVILAWMGIGVLVARARGPPGAAKSFAVGAATALGAALLVFTASCFLAIA